MVTRRTDPAEGRAALAAWASAPDAAARPVLAPAVRHTLELVAEEQPRPGGERDGECGELEGARGEPVERGVGDVGEPEQLEQVVDLGHGAP